MVHQRPARRSRRRDGSLLFVENVGNLVCPALFDLGEHAKVVVISVTEGDDKPLKYPHMFAAADLVVVNKTDLLPYVDFDLDRLTEQARSLNPGVKVLPLSVRTGETSSWSTGYAWLDALADPAGTERGATWSNRQSVRRASASTTLLDEVAQSAVPAVMQRVEELLRSVMSLYGAGLDGRSRSPVDADDARPPAGRRRDRGQPARAPRPAPRRRATRVQRALDQVRPYLGSHAGGVSLSVSTRTAWCTCSSRAAATAARRQR